MARDYYAVLGVALHASATQIRRAYQRLARQYSPDVNLWQHETRALFDEIAEAYRVLSDPMARAVYDRGQPGSDRAAPRLPTGPGTRRGDDLHVPVELAFHQAITGLDMDLAVDRLSPCGACVASGAAAGSVPATCGYCAGLGTIWNASGAPSPTTCPACGGAGLRVLEPCAECRGRGVKPARGVVRVSLPPGMDSGAQVRIRGEGHSGPYGGPRGDVIVIARVHEDPRFIRKGDNVYTEVWVGIAEVILGSRVVVRGVEGDVDLVLPPGTQAGQVLRVRGRGVPRLSGRGRGDLCVTVRVDIPRDLDARTQELVRELGRVLPSVPRTALERSGRP